MLQRQLLLLARFSTNQVVKSYQELSAHKWLSYDETHKNSLQTHKSRAEEYIHRVPVIEVDADVVRCMGGTQINAGHPQVYIKLDTRNDQQAQTCKYCGLRYAMKHHH